MINITCFLWRRIYQGMQLPTAIDNYKVDHVINLHNMVKRNVTIPYTFTCITDVPESIPDYINTVKLWDKCKFLGGCYNRLFIFDSIMKQVLGKRFICIDLDCVILGNIDHILTRPEPFVINKYHADLAYSPTHQFYNGGLILQTAGIHKELWEDFDYENSPKELEVRRANKELCGSDQAWISHKLGEGQPVFDEDDGVYDFRRLPDKDNPNTDSVRIVFFPGKRDPSVLVNRYEWIKDNWK